MRNEPNPVESIPASQVEVIEFVAPKNDLPERALSRKEIAAIHDAQFKAVMDQVNAVRAQAALQNVTAMSCLFESPAALANPRCAERCGAIIDQYAVNIINSLKNGGGY